MKTPLLHLLIKEENFLSELKFEKPVAVLLKICFFDSAFTTGYLNQMIPTIEKRFQMTSKDLGIIAASQDIPGLIIIGFVSYFGEHGNKIKWLGYGGIITGQLYVFF